MRPVSDGFERVLVASHQRAARVSILNPDLTPLVVLTGTDGVVIEGSVSMDADRRRSCSFSLVDPDGTLVPADASDFLFPNRLVRLERGVVVDGSPELVSLGVYLVDRPETTVDGAGVTIRIDGQDRLKLALKSSFTRPVTYEAGMPVADVIRSIAQDAGMGEVLYRLDDGGRRLAATRTFDTDTQRVPAMQTVAEAYALDVFVDADGYLALAPQASSATVGDPVFSFVRGEQAIMLGITRGFDDEPLRNHTLVSGEGSDLLPVRGEARDLNPDSPVYNPLDGTGPVGDRLDVYTSAMIRSSEQAQEVADARLLQVALIQESITIPSLVHPALEVGDPIGIAESRSRTSDTYLIDTLAIPLGTGAMTTTARKLRSLS